MTSFAFYYIEYFILRNFDSNAQSTLIHVYLLSTAQAIYNVWWA